MQTQGNYRLRMLVLGVTAALASCLLALALATPPAQAAFPGLNGKIVFGGTRDGTAGIYTMNPDGSNATRLTNDGGLPAWSADGTKLAFVSNGEIHVMDADGSNRVQLTSNSVWDHSPAWSPDGSRIAFIRDLPAGEGQILPKIYLMNAEGSNEVQVRSETTFSEESPDWSPDGSKIAFVGVGATLGGSHIYTMNVDGTGLTSLTGKKINSTTKNHPDWSPDGSKIVYGKYAQRAGTPYDIMVMNADGTGKTNLTRSLAVNEIQPAFSPNGRKIVFVTDKVLAPGEPQDYNHREIWKMRADGTNLVQLTTNTTPDTNPDWQPLP